MHDTTQKTGTMSLQEGLAVLAERMEDKAARPRGTAREKRTRADIAMEHPQWDRELQLEERMLSDGREAAERQLAKARERKTMSRTGASMALTEDLLTGIAAQVKGWMLGQANATNRRAVAFKPMSGVPSDVLALIGLRCLLDDYDPTNGTGSKYLGLAYRIGAAAENEAKMRMWEERRPNIWYRVQRNLARDHATQQHRAIVNINRFNALVAADIGWRDWTSDERRNVGFTVIKCMVEGSKGNIYQEKAGTYSEAPWIVSIDDDTRTWMLDAMDSDRYVNPTFMPMVMPPAPWSNMWNGGYVCGILKQRTLIRFRADNNEQAHRGLDELGKVKMPKVYKALNAVQSVAWAVNKRVLEVVNDVWAKDLGYGGFIKRQAEDVPFADELADKDHGTPEERQLWRRAAGRVRKRNHIKVTGALVDSRLVRIANLYADEPHIYFPHTLDFRGRAYPIPVGLQPQGTDIAKGLLTYSEDSGKPLGNGGAYWLAIHLANVWGKDKLPFMDRVKWVADNTDLFRKVANDPLRCRRWQAKGTEPWQALAATFEWVRYLDEGEGMVSCLPIRLDGTCNGIQHLSAMVRDNSSGDLVNLVPHPNDPKGDRPRDIYSVVGVDLMATLWDLSDSGDASQRAHAAAWLHIVGDKMPRLLTKRPVMILPYGGTKRAYSEYTNDWFNDPDGFDDPDYQKIDWQTRRMLVNWLVNYLWDAVSGRLPRAHEVQKWLQQCARLAAAAKPPAGVKHDGRGLPLIWETPDGFLVRHFYGEFVGRSVETMVDGQRIRMKDYTITKDLDLEAQLQGIPPNFVHSMDGCMMRMAVNAAKLLGINSITCVHDAFGTVAADVDMLNVCLREAFIEMYKTPILESYRDACLRLIDGELKAILKMPPVPKMGDLSIDAIANAKYMFA